MSADPTVQPEPVADPISTPADDPGGAHAKGYTAEGGTAAELPDPIPLADAPPGGIHVPERDDGVQPTGRDEPDSGELIVSGGR